MACSCMAQLPRLRHASRLARRRWMLHPSCLCHTASLPAVQPPCCRLACVSIGISMDVLVCSLCFPVTTEMLLKQRLLRALWGLADLAEGLAAQQAQQAAGAGGGAAPACKSAASSSSGKDEGSGSASGLADAEAIEAGMAAGMSARAAGTADLPATGPTPAAAEQRQKLRAQARKVRICCSWVFLLHPAAVCLCGSLATAGLSCVPTACIGRPPCRS